MDNIFINFTETLNESVIELQKKISKLSGIDNLSDTQFKYINTISKLTNPTITQISDYMDLTKASVTVAINRLVEKEYIVKKQSTDDMRIFHLELTNKGKIVVDAREKALIEFSDYINSSLSKEEIIQFREIIKKITELI